MKKILLYILITIALSACKKYKCNTINSDFQTFEEAKNVINNTRFKYCDDIKTSKSSWIRSASYYSCDKKVGFLIISTDVKDYTHKNVPIEMWHEFKNADSYGKYYNRNLKGRSQFHILN